MELKVIDRTNPSNDPIRLIAWLSNETSLFEKAEDSNANSEGGLIQIERIERKTYNITFKNDRTYHDLDLIAETYKDHKQIYLGFWNGGFI